VQSTTPLWVCEARRGVSTTPLWFAKGGEESTERNKYKNEEVKLLNYLI
jgi:hypothetical protein